MIRILPFGLVILLLLSNCVVAQVVIEERKTPEELVNYLMGANKNGIKISDVKYTGSIHSVGVYRTLSKHMPITKGIVLTTGNVEDVDGPNQKTNMGTALFSGGDAQLEHIVGNKTKDAAILEFQFYANSNEVSFYYFFASEEYPEYVNLGVNDIFAFLISGKGYHKPTNIALLPDSENFVSVDNINANKNSQYFIQNIRWNISNPVIAANPKIGEISYNCEFDGMTTMLKATAKLIPYQQYSLRLAIADVGDNIYDSGVFIKKGSLSSSGEEQDFAPLLVNDLNEFSDTLLIRSKKQDGDSVRVVSNINFAFNSHELSPESEKAIKELAELFKGYFDVQIKIEGHSDDVGDKAYNMKLSELRANEVYKLLIRGGVSANKLSYSGKGDDFPLNKGVSEEARRQNRRVEFIIFK